MAKQIIQKLLDDLDGSNADETVHFSLDGVGYEIDLSAPHATELRTFLATYQDAGTRTGRVETGRHAQLSKYGPSKPAQNPMDREQNRRIRTWAAEHGWELAERGRIPQMIMDAFDSRTPNPEWLAKQNAAQKLKDETDAKPAKAAAGRRRGPAAQPEFAGA